MAYGNINEAAAAQDLADRADFARLDLGANANEPSLGVPSSMAVNVAKGKRVIGKEHMNVATG